MQIPLALYIHFPWCVQKCPYCDFNSHALRDTMPEEHYIQALIADWQQDLQWIGDREISSIFCGGGTPSLFSGKSLQQLFNTIAASAPLKKALEITLEANPGTLGTDSLEALCAAGVNRLSIGAQSFQRDKLRALGRIHGPEAIGEAMHSAKKAGFTRINLDLMYGLPQQTINDALYDLQQACQLQPTHLSWYQLTLEPNTPFYRTPPPLPTEEDVITIAEKGEAYLQTQGYQRYEISAYCQNKDYCRHNVNYWQYGDYIGIGAGAHGKITLKDGTILRTVKKKHPKQYLEGNGFMQEKKAVTQKEALFEFMLNALRLQDKIAWTLLEQRSGWQRQAVFVYCDDLVQKGLLEYNENEFYLTPMGRNFTNEAIAAFLP
jgi:oxygen-independent coproporphyrinogen-3 oxidase